MAGTNVVSAVPQDNVTIRVTFSADMLNDANLITPAHYTFNGGLVAEGVIRVDATHVDIQTSPQVGSKIYLLTVNQIIRDLVGDPLEGNTATFTGITTPAAFVVQNLVARTFPSGNRIDLEWLNPSGALYTRIMRKTRGFPYDESDGIEVYDGAVLTEYSDTGLQDNQFYYYAVFCSEDGVTWEVNEASLIEGLSIRQINSKDWIWKNVIPRWEKKRQTTVVEGALLEAVVDVLGAGLDLIRGELEAYDMAGDLDRAPIGLLEEWNRSLGFEPETVFDHAALRRMPLHLIEIYKNKGTIPSIEQLVNVLVQWEITGIIEFGGEEGTLFKTWDGLSTKDYGLDTSAVIAATRGDVTHTGKTWTPSEWADGFIRDGIGDLINVLDNDADSLTLEPQTDPITSVRNTSPSGQKVLYVNSTAGAEPFDYLLISEGSNHQVASVKSVVPNQSITFQENLKYTFTTAAKVYPGTDLIRAEVLGTGSAIANGLSDTSKLWVTNQWKGFYLLDSANTKWLITSNTVNQVFVSGGSPAAGSYAISRDFTLGGSFAARQPKYRYDVYVGAHYFLYEPTISPAYIGTVEDPFDRLYAGISGLGAGFTNDDYAIFIKAGVALFKGRVSGVSLNTITDSTATFTPGALAGLFINPSRKQRRMFEIVDNTATEIQLNQSVEGIVAVDDYYFVLTERDMLRYLRLNAVLPKFHSRFTRGYVFFE